MARYTPATPATITQVRTELNKVAAAINTMLDRDGTLPNQMESDFDMNGYNILNAKVGGIDLDELAKFPEWVQKSHDWAVAPEFVFVNDGINPIDYSSYHYSRRSSDYAAWAADYSESAEQAASNAATQATIAANQANIALQLATLSANWAVGPDGSSGTPSNTNNSEYWAQQAQASAGIAEGSVDSIEAFATAAENSANAAAASATSASNSAGAAAGSASSSLVNATNAANSASNAANSATSASESSASAGDSATAATNQANIAKNQATVAQQATLLAANWAVGPDGSSGTPSATNNAEYWAQQAQLAAGGVGLAESFGTVSRDGTPLNIHNATVTKLGTGVYRIDVINPVRSNSTPGVLQISIVRNIGSDPTPAYTRGESVTYETFAYSSSSYQVRIWRVTPPHSQLGVVNGTGVNEDNSFSFTTYSSPV